MVWFDFQSISGSLRIELLNLEGKLIKSIEKAQVQEKESMNLSEMASGVYLFKLMINGKQISEGKLNIVK